MQWFPSSERGFALGIRQTAIPVGGLISALVLPMLGLRAAFVFLAVLCLAGAAFGFNVGGSFRFASVMKTGTVRNIPL